MEEPEPRWDAGSAAPSAGLFANVNTAGLSCMSPGPR